MKVLLSILALAYVLSPYDLFPDLIIGWGWVDDLIILGLLWWYFFVYRKKRVIYDGYYERSRGSGEKRGEGSHDDRARGGGNNFRDEGASRDPYVVLEIGRSASPEEIRKAYRKLANKYHPDKVNHLGEEFRELAGRRFSEIHNAYQELMAKANDPRPHFHK
jgi:hypothetical protein